MIKVHVGAWTDPMNMLSLVSPLSTMAQFKLYQFMLKINAHITYSMDIAITMMRRCVFGPLLDTVASISSYKDTDEVKVRLKLTVQIKSAKVDHGVES